MTERLYYDDSYLRSFDAVVTASNENPDKTCTLFLDRSAFYPTSGGQPFDTGTVNGIEVIDVAVTDDGDVAHKTASFIPAGTKVHCEIDWERRFDHMQQHAGEHILAGCVWRELKGHTTGLHLGHDSSSIDVDFPDGRTHLEKAEIRMLEDEVNRRIQADVPIKCWFPDEAELASLPLRKPPTVASHIRIVQIGDDEFCACGGTHPESAGQIGLFKLIDVRPSRGKVRFTFVCGKRAFEYFRTCFDALDEVNRLTSSTAATVSDNVSNLITRLKDAEYKLQEEKNAAALRSIDSAVAACENINGIRIVKHVFDGANIDALTKAASAIIQSAPSIALLASKNTDQSLLLLYARSENIGINMGAVMKNSGARGGGKPDFARGSSQDIACLETAYRICMEELK